MSEIKVNKLTPKTNCGTVTLGDSGDTFTFPAGVTITNNGTQTGFGRTGTVDWNTTKITADPANAVSGTGYFCDTSGAAFTVTLPSSPSAGDIVAVADYTRTFNTYNLTIGRNSKPIGGVSEDAILNVDGQSATFVFVDDTEGWINVQETQTSQTGAYTHIQASVTGTCNSIAISGDYKIATFKNPGTFSVTGVSGTPATDTVDYAIVGGGGGSGAAEGAGGGGGGGFRETPGTGTGSYSVSPIAGSVSALVATVQSYPVVVGGGGTGAPGCMTGQPRCGTFNGSVSTFNSQTSAGGGGGGFGNSNRSGDTQGYGGSGGSGGGAAGRIGSGCTATSLGVGNTPPTSPAQGTNSGGAKTCTSDDKDAGGGGGGATAAGTNASNPQGPGGAGGTGATTSITGSPVGYAGGGGGGGNKNNGGGTATQGGGAGGASTGCGLVGTAGTAFTGGGGGGPSQNPGNLAGTNGGSGVVLIRYKFQN